MYFMSGEVILMSKQRDDTLQLLKNAQLTLTSYENARRDHEQMTADAKAISKQLAAEMKAVENEISAAVKMAQSRIDATTGSDLKLAADQLKKAVARKEKAKNKSIRKRIRLESEPLETENKALREAGRSALLNAGISPVFNHSLFYRLFSPKGIVELLILAVLFIIVDILIPAVIYMLIPAHKLYHFILLFAAFTALSTAIYVLIYKATRGRDPGAVIHARKNYDLARINKRKIKALTHAIQTDTSESMYGLDDLTETLNQAQEKYDQLQAQYQQEMAIFESQTRPDIDASIREQHQAQLDALQEQLRHQKAVCSRAREHMQQLADTLENRYTSVIGKKYMKTEALARLETTLLENPQMTTIEEAIEFLK